MTQITIVGWEIAKPIHKPLHDSYFVKLSVLIIKTIYPAFEKGVPQVDTFMKQKVLSLPTPEVAVPKVNLPNITLPSLPAGQ